MDLHCSWGSQRSLVPSARPQSSQARYCEQQPALQRPAPSVRRPQTAQTARPQSTRFLQETLAKLSEDSIRIGCRLVANDEGASQGSRSPSPPPFRDRSPLALPEQAEILYTREALPGRGHRSHDGASAMGEAPAWEESQERLEEIAGCIDNAVGASHECGVSDLRNAMLAVAKVISMWEKEARAAAWTFAKDVEMQTDRYMHSQERSNGLQRQLSTLEERLERLDKRVQDRNNAASDFEAGQRLANGQVESRLQNVIKAINDASCRSSREADSLRQEVGAECASVRRHVSGLFVGSEGVATAATLIADPLPSAADGAPTDQLLRIPTDQQLQQILDRLHEVARVGMEDTEHWRVAADRFHLVKQEAVSATEAAQALTAEARSDVGRLEEEVAGVKIQLQQSQLALDRTAVAPGAQALRRINDIVKRGRVRIDRESGRVEMTGLNFAPVRNLSGQPTPEFQNRESAEHVVGDIVELWRLFDGCVECEVQLKPSNKSGTAAFSEALAGAQARFLAQELERGGIPGQMVTSKGFLLKNNQPGSVQLRFLRDVFLDAVQEIQVKSAQPKSPRPKSPRPRA